ncbi:hypothetical protein JTB14_038437 [Gonioctena quinquepunctata]|nr:hypothetical protein JTB14_038437 [Gonioctena quinquepunctata]
MAFRDSYQIYRWQHCAGSCDKPENVMFDEGTQKNDITKQISQDEFRGKLQLGKMISEKLKRNKSVVLLDAEHPERIPNSLLGDGETPSENHRKLLIEN